MPLAPWFRGLGPSLLALLLGGCGAAAGGAGASVELVVPTDNGHRIEGPSVWEGRYDCAQGLTGLTLELVGTGGARVSAVFRFHAVPENPDVPSGSYTLLGTVRGDGSIDLVPERWLEQPEGYVMVGMTGVLVPERGLLRGAITHPACAAFELRRVR
jgi:hypothetical protein